MRTQNSVNQIERSLNEKNQETPSLEGEIDELDERVENLEARLDSFTSRIYQKFNETFEIPGLLGELGKFKSLREFIEFSTKSAKENKDSLSINLGELKVVKDKVEASLRNISALTFKIERSTQISIEKAVGKLKNELTDNLKNLDLRVNEVRSEKLSGAAELKQNALDLVEKIEKIKEFDRQINQDFASNRKEILDLNRKTENKFVSLEKEYLKIKNKFEEVAEFIKDVRFKRNLDLEGATRRDFSLASHKLSCNKEDHSNCFDFSPKKSFNRKISQLSSLGEENERLLRPTYTSQQKSKTIKANKQIEVSNEETYNDAVFEGIANEMKNQQKEEQIVSLKKKRIISAKSSVEGKEKVPINTSVEGKESKSVEKKERYMQSEKSEMPKKSAKVTVFSTETVSFDPVQSARFRKSATQLKTKRRLVSGRPVSHKKVVSAVECEQLVRSSKEFKVKGKRVGQKRVKSGKKVKIGKEQSGIALKTEEREEMYCETVGATVTNIEFKAKVNSPSVKSRKLIRDLNKKADSFQAIGKESDAFDRIYREVRKARFVAEIRPETTVLPVKEVAEVKEEVREAKSEVYSEDLFALTNRELSQMREKIELQLKNRKRNRNNTHYSS